MECQGQHCQLHCGETGQNSSLTGTCQSQVLHILVYLIINTYLWEAGTI